MKRIYQVVGEYANPETFKAAIDNANQNQVFPVVTAHSYDVEQLLRDEEPDIDRQTFKVIPRKVYYSEDDRMVVEGVVRTGTFSAEMKAVVGLGVEITVLG